MECLSRAPIDFLTTYVSTLLILILFQFIYRLDGAYSVGILLYHNYNNLAANDSHVLVSIPW